jgi:anti-anti-sigma factor
MYPVQTQNNNQRVLKLAGRFDAHRVNQFQDSLQTDQPTFVDLSQVSFIDLSGIAALQSAQDRFRDANEEFCITGMSDTVRLILELTGVVNSMAIVFAGEVSQNVHSVFNPIKQASKQTLFKGKLLMQMA